jgi:hypothetical protein
MYFNNILFTVDFDFFHVYVWQFRPTGSTLNWGGGSALDAALMKKESRERLFRIHYSHFTPPPAFLKYVFSDIPRH